MAEKFRNKYRILSARLFGWNYAANGLYFITICTHEMNHFFGKIEKEEMVLSHIGVIADICWHEIPTHFPDVELGEFVVMPNHIHGILHLNKPETNTDLDVETLHATSLPDTQHAVNNEFMASISPKSNSIPAIIRAYKSAVSKHSHRLGFSFNWQPRYYDHIIRNQKAYMQIAEYIVRNPSTWPNDKFYNFSF